MQDAGSVFTCLPERAIERAVVDVEHAGIGHEQLVGGDTLVSELAHLGQALVWHVGDDHVERVIDGGLAVGLGVPRVEALDGALALGLNREVDDARGAAPRCRPGAGLEVIGRDGAPEGHIEVRMGVDAAGNDQAVFGVEDGVGVHVEVFSDEGDFFIFDVDVGEIVVGGGDDVAVFDEYAHWGSPRLSSVGEIRPSGWHSSNFGAAAPCAWGCAPQTPPRGVS